APHPSLTPPLHRTLCPSLPTPTRLSLSPPLPRRPPPPTLFPYTTLFRSAARRNRQAARGLARLAGGGAARGARPRTEQDLHRPRSEEHTSELQSRENLVCRLLLEKKNNRSASEAQRLTKHDY